MAIHQIAAPRESAEDDEMEPLASEHEMKNIISILRKDRSTIDRLAKEQAIYWERLDGIKALHQRMEAEYAQKANVKDIQNLADMKDIVAVKETLAKMEEVLASKADGEQVAALMESRSATATVGPALDTNDVYSDEDLQVRVAINSHGELLQHLSKDIQHLGISISNKADANSVVMLRTMVDQIGTKVDRPNKTFGTTETNAKADIEALKRNVTNLFKEQRRTDAQQSAEIIDLREAFKTAKGRLESSDVGQAAPTQAQTTDKDALFTGDGPVSEALVADVAAAVKDVFWEKFRKVDGALKKKVDRGELSMVLAGRGMELPRETTVQNNNQFQGGLDLMEPNGNRNPEQPNLSIASAGPSDSSYYVTSGLSPSKVPQQVRKYAGRSLSPVPRASDPNFKLPNISQGSSFT